MEKFKALSLDEMENIDGGFWQVAAVVIAGILLAGELSESMGRQYRKNYL
ncbi:MAG: class IIb bacteriocin, lactobin A/cerein 7B family [Proteiniphilum sp.]|nr:class IIb bacteriocin, lactobin A/cerein 7B family [Proteiniphilum sp.]MEA5127958.1 class IIb bacteriocin, lactobin A/cerein 7B family [Proteiniphilum sp.]